MITFPLIKKGITGITFNLGQGAVGTKLAQALIPGNFKIFKVIAHADNAPIGCVPKELDYMEYATDALAQEAYASSQGYGSDVLTGGTASASSIYDENYVASSGCDDNEATRWSSANVTFPHWWKYDFGVGVTKVVTRLRLLPFWSGDGGQVENFTLQGSNNDSDWDSIYSGNHADNGNWETYSFKNFTAYRYYRIYFTSRYGVENFCSCWEIEMMETNLLCYSESTIKQQGSYSLKGIAKQTDSLNDTLTRTVSPTIDLTGCSKIKFSVYSSRTGSNIKLRIRDSGGTWSEYTIAIGTANSWESKEWDISGISNANKDAIDRLEITIINADEINTFYLDDIYTSIEGTGDLRINIKINTVPLWNDDDRLIILEGQTSGENADFDHYIANAGDRLVIDIDQVGSSTPGGDDLLVTIYGELERNGKVKDRLSGIIDASEYDSIQLAINAANSSGNKFVWIPAGTYDITAPLSLPADGFSLIGAGRKIVTLRATSSIDAVIKQSGKRYLTIGGFRIDGNGDLANKGLWLENIVWFSKFFDIEIRDIATSALYLANAGGTLGYVPYWNLFENIQCGRVQDRGTHGIHLRGDTNLNTFINCTVAGDDFGILLENYDFGESGIRGPGSNVFVAPDIGGGDTCVGVRIDNKGLSNTFMNPYIEGVYRTMDIQERSNIVIGGGFAGNTNNKILAPNGLDLYFYKVGDVAYSHFNENPH